MLRIARVLMLSLLAHAGHAAGRDLEQWTRDAPNNPEPWLQIAETRTEPAAVRAALASALERAPRDPSVHMRSAAVLERIGAWPEALVEINGALVLKPGNAEAWAARAALHDRHARNLGSASGVERPAGYVAGEAGLYHPAMLELVADDYRQAIRLEPRPAWRLAWCDTLLALGRVDDARREYAALAKDIEGALGRTARRDEAQAIALRATRDLALAGAARAASRGDADAVAPAKPDGAGQALSEQARIVVSTIANLYRDVPEHFVRIPAAEIDADARAHFDRAAAALARDGFKVLDDVYSERDEKLLGRRIAARVLRNADGSIAAAAYRQSSPTAPVEIVEFESTTSDGVTLRTSNIGGYDLFRNPPSIAVETLPLGTSPAQVLALHRSRIALAAARAPRTEWTVIKTLDDITARSEVQRKAKRAYARERGWISASELCQMLGEPAVAELPAIRAQLRRALAK